MIKTRRFAITTLAFFALVVLAPILANLAFSNQAPCSILEAKFTPDALLPYIGSTLAATGTFALAIIAILQNRQIEQKNSEFNALRAAWEKSNTKRPFSQSTSSWECSTRT